MFMLRGMALVDGSGGLPGRSSHDGMNARLDSLDERMLGRSDADADRIHAVLHGPVIGEQLPLSSARQTGEQAFGLTFSFTSGKGEGGMWIILF